jgi:hypothetical protein
MLKNAVMTEHDQLLAAAHRISRAWSDFQKEFRQVRGSADLWALHAAGACVSDIYAACDVLAERHRRLVEMSEVNLRLSMTPGREPMEWWRENQAAFTTLQQETATLFKATYFFLRAFQDSMCVVLLRVEGLDGKNKSMFDCLRPGKEAKGNLGPVRRLLEERVPNYCEWFLRMRSRRNRIKSGQVTGNGSVHMLGEPLQIPLAYVEDDPEPHVHAGRETLLLREIIEACEQSHSLVDLAASRLA